MTAWSIRIIGAQSIMLGAAKCWRRSKGFARCFLRSRTSRQEFAAEIDGSNVAASVCGFPELVGDRSNQRLRAVPRELRSSACVSRVPALPGVEEECATY